MRILSVIAITLASCLNVVAGSDESNGIYLTREDYEKDILSYPSQSQGDILEERRMGDIKIIRNGESIYFSFGHFYGYKNKGQKYMSFGTRAFLHHYGYYKPIDHTGLFVYIQRTPHPLRVYVEEPYFSMDEFSKKYPLNIRNIRRKTHVNHSVIHELRWFQRNNSSLAYLVNDRSVVNIVLDAKK